MKLVWLVPSTRKLKTSSHRFPFRHGAAGIARTVERCHADHSLDTQPHRVVAALVQVGVRVEETLLLDLGQFGHSVDIVMAVSLDVREAEERHERKICQREPGLNRQVRRS